MRRAAFLLLAVAAALVVSGAVLAGTPSPSDVQYEDFPSDVAGERAQIERGVDREEPTLRAAVTGALPFTGFAAGTVLLGGLILTAGGYVIRRHSRRRDE